MYAVYYNRNNIILLHKMELRTLIVAEQSKHILFKNKI